MSRNRQFMVVLAALVALAAVPAVRAQVTLETSVRKVETTLDAGGEVKRQLMPADTVLPGEELRYTITFTNESDLVVDAGRIIITNPLPGGTRYVPGSAGGAGTRVEFSTDGETFTEVEPAVPDASATGPAAAGEPAREPQEPASGSQGAADAAPGDGESVASLRWIYQEDLAPGEQSEVFFHVRIQ